MGQGLTDRLAFLRAFLAHPRRVGAVLPTSRWAVRDMLDMADVHSADLVVELGAGTGVYTREILARLRPDAHLMALERDPRLARLLTEQYQDSRVRVICDSAENVQAHLKGARTELVISGLPFTSLGSDVRQRIFSQIVDILAPGGVALVLQYSPVIQGQLRGVFPYVERRVSLLNVPPAFLFACSMTWQPARDRR
jgi:phospholipid N-methyltransferase